MGERNTDYSTASANGMEFIGGRWVFAGPKGYRVKAADDGTFMVVSYAHTSERVAGSQALGLTEDEAHAMAARLSGKASA